MLKRILAVVCGAIFLVGVVALAYFGANNYLPNEASGEYSGGNSAESSSAEISDSENSSESSENHSDGEQNSEHIHSFVVANFIDASCVNDGAVFFECECGEKYSEPVHAKGHDYKFSGGEYIYTAKCSRCGSLKRNFADKTYSALKSEFVKIDDDISQVYLALTDCLNENSSANFGEFEDLFDKFINLCVLAENNYRIAYAFSLVDEEYTEQCETARVLYENYSAKSHSLFAEIYDSRFKDDFYSEQNGWNESSITVALNGAYLANNDEYLKCLKDYEDCCARISSATQTGGPVNDLYCERVNVNKKIAAFFGYDGKANDGFIEYAYKNRYGRDYSPRKTADIKSNVKKYVVPLFKKLYESLGDNGKIIGDFNSSIYNSEIGGKSFSDYLKFIDNIDKKIGSDYYEKINSAFKNGYVLNGNASGSFALKTSSGGVIYLGSGGNDAFSLAHEVGHYLCEDGIVYGVPLDFAETAAVLNETLFLAYITSDENSLLTAEEKNAIKNEKLLNLASVIIAACMIDDFETAVYSDYYYSGDFCDGINPADYGLLFKQILKDYGVENYISENYWKNAALNDSCYYFSYAISSLVSLSEYAKIKETDFSAAAKNLAKLISKSKICALKANESGVKLCSEYFEKGHFCEIEFCSILSELQIKSLFDENFYIQLSENV